jgi:hypothetical protein
MAKLIQSQKSSSSRVTVNEYLKSRNTTYNTFNKQKSLSVTYYSIDLNNSTHDANLFTVNSMIGSESPIKYIKIANFPLFNFEISQEFDQLFDMDNGTTVELEGSAIVVNSSIRPNVEDFFIIEDSITLSKVLLRVKNTATNTLGFVENVLEADTIGSGSYKISFYKYKVLEEIEESLVKQISNELIFNERVSLEENRLVFSKLVDYEVEAKTELLLSTIVSKVKNAYFDYKTGCYRLVLDRYDNYANPNKPKIFIDQLLNLFIMENKLFENAANQYEETVFFRDLTKYGINCIPLKHPMSWIYKAESIETMQVSLVDSDLAVLPTLVNNHTKVANLPFKFSFIDLYIPEWKSCLNSDFLINEPIYYTKELFYSEDQLVQYSDLIKEDYLFIAKTIIALNAKERQLPFLQENYDAYSELVPSVELIASIWERTQNMEMNQKEELFKYTYYPFLIYLTLFRLILSQKRY